MTEHTSKNYEEELEDLRTRVMSLGGVVESLLETAVDAYDKRDDAKAQSVLDTEQTVRKDWLAAEHLCVEVIALRQPAAKDLRVLLGFIRTLSDLKRITKQSVKIAKMVLRHPQSTVLPRINGIIQAASMAIQMLNRALDALGREDVSCARMVMKSDGELNDQYAANMRQLITYMMEDPRTISAALDVLWVAKAIERIGDYAENIAEVVIYMVEGEDVRARGVHI